jgi:hypothetical protein
VVSEFENELARLKLENDDLRSGKELAEKNYTIVMNDNHSLNVKLENLESVFIGNPIQKGDNKNQQRLISDEYMATNVGIVDQVTLGEHRAETTSKPAGGEEPGAADPAAREDGGDKRNIEKHRRDDEPGERADSDEADEQRSAEEGRVPPEA